MVKIAMMPSYFYEWMQHGRHIKVEQLAHLIDKSPDDVWAKFHEWLGTQTWNWDDGFAICRGRALRGMSMPWDSDHYGANVFLLWWMGKRLNDQEWR